MYLRICLAAGRLVGGHGVPIGLPGLAISSIGIYVQYCTASGRIAPLHLGVHQAHARDDSGSRAGVLDISVPSWISLVPSWRSLVVSWRSLGWLGDLLEWLGRSLTGCLVWYDVYAVVEYSIKIDK